MVRRKREAWGLPRHDGMMVGDEGVDNAVDAVKSSLQHGDEKKMKHDVVYVCMRDMQIVKDNQKQAKK